MVDFFSIGKSLQFSGVFLVGLISSIYLLSSYKNNRNLFLLFFITGGLTAFFDLLTTPLVPLGLLLIIAVHLEKKQKIILNCIFWVLGYLLFWSSKWLMVEIFVAPGALSTSFNQIINRTVNQADANFSQFKAVQLNLLQLIGYSRYSRALYIFVNSIFFFGLLRYLAFTSEKAKKIIPWVLMIFIPYLWYFVAANHSYLHCWYTYRDQLISVVSLCFITSEFIDWDYIKKDLKGLFAHFTFKSHQS